MCELFFDFCENVLIVYQILYLIVMYSNVMVLKFFGNKNLKNKEVEYSCMYLNYYK